MLRRFLVPLLFVWMRCAESCTPFGRESLAMMGASSELSRPSVTNNNLFPSSSVRARGEKNTHFVNGVSKANREMSVSLGVPSSASIVDASELNCADFDEKCRWRNVDGMFVDELDWYQGSGELDPARLAVATATNILPEGQYAIAATDMVQFPTVKAVLVSDEIACQVGDGEIRFMYWTSPEVQLKVCVKKMSKVYPDFDFCSSVIEKNDPGPVFVNIPEQGPVPFQIYIIAEHFTFNSENLKGGFAIIDSIEYYARMCSSQEKASFDYSQKGTEALPLIPLAASEDQMDAHVTVKREADDSFETLNAFGSMPPMEFQLGVPKGMGASRGIVEFTPMPQMMGSMLNLKSPSVDHNEISEISDQEVTEEDVPAISTICENVVCSFNESEPCSNMATQSGWSLADGPVGNPLTGVRGDASVLPFNPDGSFAYLEGPEMKSRLQTPSFSVDKTVTVVFSYFKVDKTSSLQVFVKKDSESEESKVFEAPKLTRNSRRWFRESLNISSGSYDYLAFQVSNLRPNHYIGIDEMFVVDDRRKSFCFHKH